MKKKTETVEIICKDSEQADRVENYIKRKLNQKETVERFL